MFDVEKLAVLATDYCVPISEDKKIGIMSNTVAEPLIQQLYKQVILKGGHPVVHLQVDGMFELLFTYGNKKQLTHVSPFTKFFFEHIDGIIQVYAETNLKKLSNVPASRIRERQASQRELAEIHTNRFLRPGGWTLIPYPTLAFAQEAEMSLFEYEDFITKACFLDKTNPSQEWRKLSRRQEAIRQKLDRAKEMRFVGEDTDLKMRVEGRKWENCDGHLNMPDGEIFTGPIENSAEGKIRFTYPGIYLGREVEDITLTFKGGKVVRAEAGKGDELLQQILKTDEGASRIGEIAIGTNTGITRFTKNMLFDEKMGHCIHLALGLGIPDTGSLNKSSIHWDILKDMRKGEIYVDKQLIYQNGKIIT